MDSADDARLIYAALHLLMAVEALIYERLYAWRDFFRSRVEARVIIDRFAALLQ
ncbi:MAG: hypothetical protein ABI846_07800 [Rudaea sp.]